MGLFKSKHRDMSEIAAVLAAADTADRPDLFADDTLIGVDEVDDDAFAAAIAAAREADAELERREAGFAVSA